MQEALSLYIDYRKQDMGHDKAAAHVRQRLGVSPDELSAQIAEERQRLSAELALLGPRVQVTD